VRRASLRGAGAAAAIPFHRSLHDGKAAACARHDLASPNMIPAKPVARSPARGFAATPAQSDPTMR